MSLYSEWNRLLDEQENEREFWEEFLVKEKETYEKLLENFEVVENGTIEELAKKYNLTMVEMVGFIDGINESLNKSIELEGLEETTHVTLDINLEKLYYNMLEAKASWLYTLKQWDNILTKERRAEIKKEYNKGRIAVSNKVGRNEPCPCGSGKKYKKCCGKNV